MATLTYSGSGGSSGSSNNNTTANNTNNNNNNNNYLNNTSTSNMGSSSGSNSPYNQSNSNNTTTTNTNNNLPNNNQIDINKSNSTNITSITNNNNSEQNSFKIKTIQYNNKKVNILTQKDNGPCPLIAIINVLSLRGEIEIKDSIPLITYDGLVETIGAHLFESIKNYEDTEEQFNYEIKINDSINALPSMISGLNLDIKFTGIKDFDSSCDMSIFQVLNIDLVHGWLVEPQDVELASIIGDMTYNKLTDSICNTKLEDDFLNDVNLTNSSGNGGSSGIDNLSKSSSGTNKRNLYTDSVIYRKHPIKSSGEDLFSQFKIKQFLNDTSSQLSFHGLYELHSNLKDGEFVIFFRNNHFNTLLKKESSLYLLVTDEGYINEPIVWEKLSQIDGDTEYCLSDFKPFKKEDLYSNFDQNTGVNGGVSSQPIVNTEAMTDEELAHYLSSQDNAQNLDSDFAVALQLQNQENSRAGHRKTNNKKEKEKEKKEANSNLNASQQKKESSKMCKTQ